MTSGEMVKEKSGSLGLVLNLENTNTGVIMFYDNLIMSGDLLTRTYNTLSIGIDHSNMGSVIDPIGNPLSKRSTFFFYSLSKIFSFFGQIKRSVELKAPGIISRQPVYETLFTGTAPVDTVFPIGLGQRELIIGDRQTGKTTIASDSFLNQSSIDFLLIKFSFFFF